MDTIELSDKVGPEDECVFVDNKELYAVSRRLRELRSYRVLSLSLYLSICIKAVDGAM